MSSMRPRPPPRPRPPSPASRGATVRLTSSEGAFVVSRAAAERSPTIRAILSARGFSESRSSAVAFPSLAHETLRAVVAHLEHTEAAAAAAAAAADVPCRASLELVETAHYLQLPALLRWAASALLGAAAAGEGAPAIDELAAALPDDILLVVARECCDALQLWQLGRALRRLGRARAEQTVLQGAWPALAARLFNALHADDGEPRDAHRLCGEHHLMRMVDAFAAASADERRALAQRLVAAADAVGSSARALRVRTHACPPAVLADAVAVLPRLEVLDVRRAGLRKRGAAALGRALAALRVGALSLRATGVSERGLRALLAPASASGPKRQRHKLKLKRLSLPPIDNPHVHSPHRAFRLSPRSPLSPATPASASSAAEADAAGALLPSSPRVRARARHRRDPALALEVRLDGNAGVGDDFLRALCVQPSQLEAVVRLDLSENALGAAGAHLVADALPRLGALRSLALASCALGTRGVRAVLRAASPSLEDVDLADNADAPGWVASVAARPLLCELDASHSVADAADAALLARVVGHAHSRLRVLRLCDVAGLAGAARALATALRHNRALEAVDVAGNAFAPEDTARFAALAAYAPALERLDVSGNGFDAGVAAAFAAALARNGGLRELRMAGARDGSAELLRSAGFRLLVKGLERNHTLRVLDLSAQGIAGKACLCVLRMRDGTNLRLLRLANNQIDAAAAFELKRAMDRDDAPVWFDVDLRGNPIDAKDATRLVRGGGGGGSGSGSSAPVASADVFPRPASALAVDQYQRTCDCGAVFVDPEPELSYTPVLYLHFCCK